MAEDIRIYVDPRLVQSARSRRQQQLTLNALLEIAVSVAAIALMAAFALS
jgi:hypothetical protein